MEYLSTIRNIRNILFKAFLVNIVIVAICWIFIWTDLMKYFMWAMPGFNLQGANFYIMWMIGILHMISIALFLIPTIALSFEIVCEKRRQIREEEAFEKVMASFVSEIKPAATKAKATSRKIKKKK